MDFKYNEEHKAEFATLKLKEGFVARIYFYKVYDYNNKFLNKHVSEVALAIAKSKKDLNNWAFQNGSSRVDDTSQYSKFGIEVLIWAKKMIAEYTKPKHNNNVLIVSASNNKRFQVYKWGLKDFKKSSIGTIKLLYKIF